MYELSRLSWVVLLSLGCTSEVGRVPELGSPNPQHKGDDALRADADAGAMRAEEGPSCASTEIDVEIEVLERPADIVWVIDSSGSMSGEAALVQEHMNAFAERFSKADVDAQIIVITPTGFVSVPPPLGIDNARFFQVSRSVSSSAALRALIESFDAYGSRLRENAIVHFIAVTDDESSLRGECFVEQMQSLIGPDRRFKLHTISSEALGVEGEQPQEGKDDSSDMPVLDCSESDARQKRDAARACSGASRPGLEYRVAAQMTGGTAISICTPDWSMVFDELAGSVEKVSVIGCDFEIPEPPPGAILLADQVELVAKMNGVENTLQPVTGEASCDSGDWYYDDPASPSAVRLCPQTCDTLGEQGAQLALQLGCAWSVR